MSTALSTVCRWRRRRGYIDICALVLVLIATEERFIPRTIFEIFRPVHHFQPSLLLNMIKFRGLFKACNGENMFMLLNGYAIK